MQFLNKANTAKEHRNLISVLYASTDNAWFNLWSFIILNNIKWDTSCFFSASEEILKLPNAVRDDLLILLESKNLQEIQKATNHLKEQLQRELEKHGHKLPECSSLDEALEFLKIY